jgi:putative flippase GtrA
LNSRNLKDELVHSATAYRPSFVTSFSRAQASSLASTLMDYGVLFLFTEVFHFWYVFSTASGALVGAITNFLINRHWTFQASGGHFSRQAKRYLIVSGGSLLLNTLGVYGMTETFKIHYAISVVLVSILVGFLFNYPLHRHYVYRP